MVWLRFFHENESVAARADKLKQANVDEITGLEFVSCCFEDTIVRAVIDLFHRAFQKGCTLGWLAIHDCTDRVDAILIAASSLDMFDKISLDGGSEISQHGFWSISSAMKYNKCLTKLELQSMEITRQQAAALGAGLVTSNSQNHFKELYMNSVTFEDGAIMEIASGLKHNSSLCVLNIDRCHLGDSKLAELIDAMESHTALKELSLRSNQGQRHALVALGKVLASRSCLLEVLDFSDQGNDESGLIGWLGILAQGLRGSESLRRLNLSWNGLLDNDIDDLGQILAACKLETLALSGNEITRSGFASFTQKISKSLRRFAFHGNDFDKEEAACDTLTLFKEHPQLWDDGLKWEDSKSPIHQKIQHFKDLNQCGRILLLARDGAIPLSVWPIVLARANTLLSDNKERAPNVIFHLLQGPALMQRRFDRYSNQVTCIETGASKRPTTPSKRGPAETIDQESAKKGRSE